MDALDPTSGEIEVYFAFLAYLCHRGFRSSFVGGALLVAPASGRPIQFFRPPPDEPDKRWTDAFGD
jgi:hypothetical protein